MPLFFRFAGLQVKSYGIVAN